VLEADRIIHTTCPYCGVGCQIDVHIRDEVIFRVSGRFDNQVNFGQLCVKGRFGIDFAHAPDRLRSPLVRDRRDDDFRSTSWEQALTRVASQLAGFRDEFGPDSVAVLTSAKCTNEENYLMQKFARAVIGTNNIDHCARL
jgi:predicted molibdopterin-dependent oxidoreductase YjgC